MTAIQIGIMIGLAAHAAAWPTTQPVPVPEGARVQLVLDRPQYLLGENILVHYHVENTGRESFTINTGGDYRGASRALRFKVTAVDAQGQPVSDPDPAGSCMGGLSSSPEIRPGEGFWESLALIRYRRFDRPGTYTLNVKHDLGWTETEERKIPAATATIKLVMPTPEQARGVVEQMYRLPAQRDATWGRKCEPYADFTVLSYPVYLPILAERVTKADRQALIGIGSIATPEATRLLISLLEHKDQQFALEAARTLNARLPDPELTGKLAVRSPFQDGRAEARRRLVEASWRPEFAPEVRAAAKRLLSKDDRPSVQCGAFMIQAVGTKDDLTSILAAWQRAIAKLDSSLKAERGYPQPGGSCYELERAARTLLARGAEPSATPDSPAQIALYLTALGSQEGFRPAGWERHCAGWLRHELPYIRELALRNMPTPVPDSVVKLLPTLLGDSDLSVQTLACDLAGKVKTPELREPVLTVVATAKERWLMNQANNAALACGAQVEALEIWASRLDETELTQQLISFLLVVVEDQHGHGFSGGVASQPARQLKERWTRFLKEHREELKAGRRFRIGDPELKADLFPAGFKLYRSGGNPWP